MNKSFVKRLGLKLVLLTMLAMSQISNAQTYFTSTGVGDVYAGFRKMNPSENYEMVVYLGNVSNFLAVAAGTTINITNYTHQQLTNMCPDNLNNLQWSVFASFGVISVPLTNAFGVFPLDSCWYTVPRTSPSVQTTPVNRFSLSNEGTLKQQMLGAGVGANNISQNDLVTTNVYNNTLVVLEPTALDKNSLLTTWIGDSQTPANGDFGGQTFSFTVENTTPAPFTSAVVSDFYLNVPVKSGAGAPVDPLTGKTTGTADYLGYFTLNPNGTMTYTAASSASTPVVGSVTTTATNGFAPLQVIFTNTASSGATNWVWNFGNGTVITNTTSGNVTNTYSTDGNYTVILTVNGTGGSSSSTNYIKTSPTPKLSTQTIPGGKLVFSGTNCPVGVQYRILTATNATSPLASWKPVFTNTFLGNGSYAYTNNSTTNASAFFRLVSP